MKLTVVIEPEEILANDVVAETMMRLYGLDDEEILAEFAVRPKFLEAESKYGRVVGERQENGALEIRGAVDPAFLIQVSDTIVEHKQDLKNFADLIMPFIGSIKGVVPMLKKIQAIYSDLMDLHTVEKDEEAA